MRILILFLVGFFTAQALFAQDFAGSARSQEPRPENLPDELGVERDARLDKLLEWHIEKNREREGMEGFRVEIFFSSKMDAREQALNTKVDFLKKYPDYPVHIKFVAPNFRVRVGDFRTKNEAWKLYREIQGDYPTAFVVPDNISFPLLNSKKNE